MSVVMEQSENRNTHFKLVIVWLAILVLSGFWLTVRETSGPVSMVVVPEAPREGEPIVATFKLNNPSSQSLVTRYQFYANGELLKEGLTTIGPDSSKTYQYAYKNLLQIGEQINFVVRTQSDIGSSEFIVSSPPYPPQIWSSFVSFASFSTSVMSSMSTMVYYQDTFSSDLGPNVGLLVSAVLIALLIFKEITQPLLEDRKVARKEQISTSVWRWTSVTPSLRLGRLRLRFSTIIWILSIIFLGIAYTKITMIITV
jgi:hypothetical protein